MSAYTDVILRSPSCLFSLKDGLAIGIQPTRILVNIYVNSFEDTINENASIFARHVDDILVDVQDREISNRLRKITTLCTKLDFI